MVPYSRNILLTILSGLMLTASFPPGKLDWLSWIALIPLLKAIEKCSPMDAFRLGFVAGLAHFTSLIYWIVFVVGYYGNLNIFLSITILILFCMYLALYPAFFSGFVAYFRDTRFFIFSTAGCWVGLEYLRAVLFTGFPWCLLGYSQYVRLPVIQIADIFGVYGVSFLILMVNGAIYGFISRQYRKSSVTFRIELCFIILAILSTVIYGHHRLKHNIPSGNTQNQLRAVIAQGNIDQSVKWDPSNQAKTMEVYFRLSEAAHSFKPQLIIWPETAVPFFFQENEIYSSKMITLTKKLRAHLVFGSNAYEWKEGKLRYFNRAYLIHPTENKMPYYDKIHLVPFGEYVPLKDILFFVNRLVQAAGSFEPGRKSQPLIFGTFSGGILICYEAIFPELARAQAKAGATVLINLTNDAWYGMTSAPYQHLILSVFRSIENRLPLIRAANTGFSAFIDSKGKIQAKTRLFSETQLRYSLNAYPPSPTVYTRFGDFFAITVLALVALKFSLYWFSLRRKRIHNIGEEAIAD